MCMQYQKHILKITAHSLQMFGRALKAELTEHCPLRAVPTCCGVRVYPYTQVGLYFQPAVTFVGK